jgi:predicted amidophosphoribosyltransferase
MNCQFCSNKIFETDRYCPSCGAPNKENNFNCQKNINFNYWNWDESELKQTELEKRKK